MSGDSNRKDGIIRASGGEGGGWRLPVALGAGLLTLAGGVVWLAGGSAFESAADGELPLVQAHPRTGPPPSPSAPRRTTTRPGDAARATIDEPLEAARAMSDDVPSPDLYGSAKTGLQLFVPGTKPVKRGIIVPEDFELPAGFVRHYQTTDDGEQLQAILMFHPDHTPTDADGKPVAVPEGRVVPPELAPKDLPIELLVPPEPKGQP